MAAKNWWDAAAPTMEMGGLLGMPSMSPTEEDKRQALKQMLMQMGMGMVANSHKGNQAALGAGLLGGVQGYQQGMQGPMNRFEMAKQQLDFQGKQLGNAKAYGEVQQSQNLDKLLSGIGNVTGNPFEQVAQGNGAWGQGPLAPDAPEVQQGNAKAQAAMFNNPAFLAKLAANGMKGGDIKALGDRFDPQQVAAGGYSRNPITGQMTYNADPVKGIGMGPQGVYNLPGSVSAAQERTFADEAIKAKFANWQKEQEAGRDVVTLQNSGKPKQVLRSQLGQELGGQSGQIGPNDPQPAATYSNAEAARMYAQMPDGPEKQSLARALQGGTQQGGAGMGVHYATKAAEEANASGLAQYDVKNFSQAQEDAQTARRSLPQIQRMISLIDSGQLSTDKLGNIREQVGGYLSAMGMSDPQKKAALSNIQSLRTVLADMTLTSPRLPGSASNLDMQLLERRNGAITDDTQALRMNLAFAAAQREQQEEYAAHLRSARSQNALDKAEQSWIDGKGSESIWLKKNLRQYLPVVVNAQGKKAYQLPDGRYVAIDDKDLRGK